jgi:hypothetical protein
MSPLNDNVFPLHVPKLAQALPERFYAACASGSSPGTQESYTGNFLWLLPRGYGRNSTQYRRNQK